MCEILLLLIIVDKKVLVRIGKRKENSPAKRLIISVKTVIIRGVSRLP